MVSALSMCTTQFSRQANACIIVAIRSLKTYFSIPTGTLSLVDSTPLAVALPLLFLTFSPRFHLPVHIIKFKFTSSLVHCLPIPSHSIKQTNTPHSSCRRFHGERKRRDKSQRNHPQALHHLSFTNHLTTSNQHTWRILSSMPNITSLENNERLYRIK